MRKHSPRGKNRKGRDLPPPKISVPPGRKPIFVHLRQKEHGGGGSKPRGGNQGVYGTSRSIPINDAIRLVAVVLFVILAFNKRPHAFLLRPLPLDSYQYMSGVPCTDYFQSKRGVAVRSNHKIQDSARFHQHMEPSKTKVLELRQSRRPKTTREPVHCTLHTPKVTNIRACTFILQGLKEHHSHVNHQRTYPNNDQTSYIKSHHIKQCNAPLTFLHLS